MFIDFVLYTFVMFYLDKVFPSKYGVRRPFYAPFECMDAMYDRIGCCRERRGRGLHQQTLNSTEVMLQDEMEDTKTIESVDESVTGPPLLHIDKLTKIFHKGNEGRDNIAVNRLNLKMYQNQVFCLLGMSIMCLCVC